MAGDSLDINVHAEVKKEEEEEDRQQEADDGQ